ncbi:N-terminal glutamine amidase-domain-containing protein [Phascolomyces articulosus]|uniref:Protein N-terminal glutamine amidohydrolase n=1 Tax=Phascolomyces articulosus TaxID=60185 RepID=A0AAD5K466_9FUNG|nr:N-terminal glutamine amidase-domain-containing protein [Phascolomyces articulosus]
MESTMIEPKSTPWKKEEFQYTSHYCEENIYMMCKTMAERHQDNVNHCTVVFISNPNKAIPIWKQKNASESDGPVVWDYHVILYYHDYKNRNFYIYDMDTELPFPCDATQYVIEAFHPELQLNEFFQRYFRMVPGLVYLKEFASDRSHMLKGDGEYIKPPPDYPAIISSTSHDTMNLPDYIDMTQNKISPEKYGIVVDEEQFFATIFSQSAASNRRGTSLYD